MATFIMIPNGTATISWDSSDGITPSYGHVDNDNGDTQYLYSATGGERIIVNLQSPSDAGVDAGDVDTINTVTLKFSGKKTFSGAGQVAVLQIGTAGDSTVISNGTNTITLPGAGSYATYSGTAETTSDGSDDWVYDDLAGLQLRVNQFRNPRFGQNRISYLYAEVDYTPTTVVTDNATFFGANF